MDAVELLLVQREQRGLRLLLRLGRIVPMRRGALGGGALP